MNRIFKTISIHLAILLLISSVACSRNQNNTTQQTQNNITQQNPIDPFEGLFTEEEYSEIQSQINNILQDVVMDLKACSGYVYFFEREHSDKLCETVGYKGLPVLIAEAAKLNDTKLNASGFLASSALALLRVDALEARYRDNPSRQYSTKKGFCQRYKDSKEQVPAILEEKIDSDEKIKKLREFGILAIPYVLKEIEKGNTEYESYFTAIGLHMEIPKYMVYMSNRDRLWEHGFDLEGFMDGAEDFDYKVWLSENEEDLNNLFKFLDAYCAEYEAEILDE